MENVPAAPAPRNPAAEVVSPFPPVTRDPAKVTVADLHAYWVKHQEGRLGKRSAETILRNMSYFAADFGPRLAQELTVREVLDWFDRYLGPVRLKSGAGAAR